MNRKTKTRQPDVSKPPANCPHCGGEREWSYINEKLVAACYFCGKCEPVKTRKIPAVAVTPLGADVDGLPRGYLVDVALDGIDRGHIHVDQWRSRPTLSRPEIIRVTVSVPGTGSTSADVPTECVSA